MQRGEVAVASAFAAPSNEFDEVERSHLSDMQQSWANPPRSGVPPPSPPPDDQDRPQHYRHSASLPGAAARRNTSKQKKPKPPYSNSPCMQFMSGYGCSFGDRCRYSHDLRALYPAYYEYDGVLLRNACEVVTADCNVVWLLADIRLTTTRHGPRSSPRLDICNKTTRNDFR
jgi:hypothetical protein